MVRLLLKNGFSLSSLQASDAIAFVQHLNDPLIHETTEGIPYPYTQDHAIHWIQHHAHLAKQSGKPQLLAIRNPQMQLIGAIGISELNDQHPYVAQLGYWLAPFYWGQGVMTEAVQVFIHYAFTDLGLLRLWTRVFEFNVRSRRVLEKNGFKLEGIQRQHVYRDSQLIDDCLYGLLKADLSDRPHSQT